MFTHLTTIPALAVLLSIAATAEIADAQVHYRRILAQRPDRSENVGPLPADSNDRRLSGEEDLLPANEDLLSGDPPQEPAEEILAPLGEASASDRVTPLIDEEQQVLPEVTPVGPPSSGPNAPQGGNSGQAGQHLPPSLQAPSLESLEPTPAPPSSLAPGTSHSIMEDDVAPQTSVDFDQLFQADNAIPTDAALAAGASFSIAMHPQGCAGGNCGSSRGAPLPPPLSLESMYRAPECDRHLWAGYEAERRRECARQRQWLRGPCGGHHPHGTPRGPILIPPSCSEGCRQGSH